VQALSHFYSKRNTAPEYPSTYKDEFPELLCSAIPSSSGSDVSCLSAKAQALEETAFSIGNDCNAHTTTSTKEQEHTRISARKMLSSPKGLITAGRPEEDRSGFHDCRPLATAQALEQTFISAGKSCGKIAAHISGGAKRKLSSAKSPRPFSRTRAPEQCKIFLCEIGSTRATAETGRNKMNCSGDNSLCLLIDGKNVTGAEPALCSSTKNCPVWTRCLFRDTS
jgi:hypothetical protein